MVTAMQSVGIGVLTTVLGTAALGSWDVFNAHATEHEEHHDQITQIRTLTESNAEYIAEQVLTQLYRREDSLRRQLTATPDDAEAANQLRETLIQIRKREAAMANPR